MLQNEPNQVAERFTEVLATLKRDRKIKKEGDLARENDYATSVISEIKAGRMAPPEKLLNFLNEKYQVSPDYIYYGNGNIYIVEAKNYIEQRRDNKLIDEPFLVPFIDVPAQAGYVKAYDQVDYIKTLKRYPILPDVDPTGAVWRYFQVEGESMEPEFMKGDVILASQVNKEDWNDFKQYYTYVVVTDTQLWIKDVYRESDKQWILLSQNEEFKPETIKVEEVKQLWVMRRHIKARAKKHKLYDIDAIRKQLKKSAKD